MACIGLHCPETQACVVTGYSHLRWQDSHDDGQFNFLYNIINGSYFATVRREAEFQFLSALKHSVKLFNRKLNICLGCFFLLPWFNLMPVAKVTNNLSLVHLAQMSDLGTYTFIGTNS